MNRKGFSLVELMIVIIILGILCAIGIPHFREMRVKANEMWALTYVRSWVAAQETYRAKYQTYADSDEELVRKGCLSAPEISGSRPNQCGYTFEIRGGADMGQDGSWRWEGWGDPVVPGATGYNHFYISSDDNFTIRSSMAGRASKTDPPVNVEN